MKAVLSHVPVVINHIINAKDRYTLTLVLTAQSATHERISVQ